MSNLTTHTLAVIASPAGARQSSLNENPGAADNPTSPLTEGVGKGERVSPTNQIYNVSVGDRTTLNQLYEQLHLNLLPGYPHLQGAKPVYRDFRAGDVRHLLADISKAATRLDYPTHPRPSLRGGEADVAIQPTRPSLRGGEADVAIQRFGEGLKVAMAWYVQHLTQQN